MKAIYESKRLAFLIVVFVASVASLFWMGIEWINLQAAAYKFTLLTSVIIFAHIVRQLMHPYLDIKVLMDSTPVTKAAAILGIFILMSSIILAFMLGI